MARPSHKMHAPDLNGRAPRLTDALYQMILFRSHPYLNQRESLSPNLGSESN